MTTVQQVYVRAKQSTPANAALIPQPTEILAVLEAEQQAIFADLAAVTRDRFQTTTTITSTNAASGRVFDLSAVTPSVERVLVVTLNDGREAHQVDVLDVDAELAPRYLVRGQTLVEVGNDWSLVRGVVAATLVYVYGPTPLSVSGNAATDFAQTISLPDQWADLLVLPLERYFAGQREATSPTELADLQAKVEARRSAFLRSLQTYGGVESKRFDIPVPVLGGNAKH